ETAIKRTTIRGRMGAVTHFQCRACDGELTVTPSQQEWISCPHCRAELPLFMNESIVKRNIITACVSCGHDILYVQKDFNRQAGLVIVGIGIAVSIYLLARGQPMFAMAALGVTALIDFLVYF